MDAKPQNGEKKPVGMRRNWTFSAFSPNGEPIKSKKRSYIFCQIKSMKKRTINILRAKKRENIKVQRRCFKERKKGEILKKWEGRQRKTEQTREEKAALVCSAVST